MMKSLHLTLLTLAGTTLAAYAAGVALIYDYDSLRDKAGVPLTTTYLAVFVVDSNGDGKLPDAQDLLGATLTLGESIGGDMVFQAKTVGASPEGYMLNGAFNVDYEAYNIDNEGGTIWGLYWFPTLSSAGQPLQGGESYGFYHNPVADEVATDIFGQPYRGMVFPAGEALTLDNGFFDPDIIIEEGGTPGPNTPTFDDFTAKYTVIPEPSSLGLSFLGLAALLRRRR